MEIGNMGHWIAWWSRVEYERKAVVFHGKCISYGELNDNINKVAGLLKEHFHVKKGDRVCCLLNNAIEYYEFVFACAKTGARFVPINIRLSGNEIGYVLKNCEPKLLISENSFLAVLDTVKDLVRKRAFINLEESSFKRLMDMASNREPEDQACWSDDFAILYTSGTTGYPKGAVLTQENIKTICQNAVTAYSHGSESKVLIQAPLCFTGGLVTLSMPMFYSGGSIVLEKTFIPQRTLELIQKENITWCAAVPTIWKVVSDLPEFADADLSSLRFAFSGGAPVPDSILKAYQEKGVTFSAGYGLTEGGGFNMYLPFKMANHKKGGYIPMMWNLIKVVNSDGNPISPGGEIGEILIKGSVVFREYWGMPEATAETIRDGWLYTGDLASIDEDGYYFIIDRVKDMIISGGLNIYPAEIENAIYMNPKVSQTAVIGLPHEKWGEIVTAVVVPRHGIDLTEEELVRFCRERLADYKSPKRVIFRKEMPMTSSGKILKRKLREEYSERVANI
ncbi:MAG: AMP-binding protein [Desulfobacterales bacterium]